MKHPALKVIRFEQDKYRLPSLWQGLDSLTDFEAGE